MTDRRDSLAQLAERIAAARTITVLTGAGVSAASGVPTFRGAGGLWRQYRAEDLATPDAFARDPRLVWEWYDWRRRAIAGCTPNAAHAVLARWSVSRRCRVVTQNVDDLHLQAGTRDLVRLHGSIWMLDCVARCGVSAWRDERVPLDPLPPRCANCGGLARPGVVWFGESLDPDVVTAAIDATHCDLFLTVGTSAVVYPAAGFVHQARRLGAYTAEVNLDATPASEAVHLALHGPAEDALEELDRLLR